MDNDKPADAVEEEVATPTEPAELEFHMVVADIVFASSRGVDTRRIQFFTTHTDLKFTAHRLKYLQNAAALNLRNALGESVKDFAVQEVYLITLHPLGRMTYDEFWGGPAPKGAEVDAAGNEVNPETPPGPSATVTPIRTN